MNLLTAKKLTDNHKESVLRLAHAAARYENLHVYYPDPDALCHYLLFSENGELASMLSVSRSPEYHRELECIAFTRPSRRRRGYCSWLLNACIADFPDMDLIFPIDHKSTDALLTMEALQAERLSTEYRMEIVSGSKTLPETRDDSLSLRQTAEDTWTLFQAKNIPVGHCQAAAFQNSFCLHHVEINPAYRRKGYAFHMLNMLLPQLFKQGARTIFLHVSEANSAATALYKKTGFRITETLSYYLY